ncbi:YbbR-like domain-containing protein [bacterium]|nr:YbbR-like domain-containing protein [bacterium]
MLKTIFSHLPAKIFSLVIAIVIWFHVITEQSFEYEFDCILKIVNIPTGYVVLSDIPKRVKIRFEGKGKELMKMYFKEQDVLIDAAGFKYGNRRYELSSRDVDLPESHVSVKEIISPKAIPIFLDRYITANLPVRSNLYITTSPGNLLAGEPSFDPAEIVVEGPQEIVDKMDSVTTVSDSLININKSMTKLIDLSVDDSLLIYIPSKTTVNIEVEQAFVKPIFSLPVSLINIPKGIRASLSKDMIDLECIGNKNNIENLNEKDIEVFIDFDDVSKIGPERLKPIIKLPEGIRCQKTDPEFFTVNLED